MTIKAFAKKNIINPVLFYCFNNFCRTKIVSAAIRCAIQRKEYLFMYVTHQLKKVK